MRLAGIFVGGKSTRMGGRAKGLLLAPGTGEPLVVRAARLARDVGLTPVLVGPAEPYAALLPDVGRVADAPENIGPLGGLGGLLRAAGGDAVVALACDMPYVSAPLLQRLLAPSSQQVVAPRNAAGFWEPLCARYDGEVLPVLDAAITQGVRAFQVLFTRLAVQELALEPSELAQLRDWDTPSDIVCD